MPMRTDGVGVEEVHKGLPVTVPYITEIMVYQRRRSLVPVHEASNGGAHAREHNFLPG